jgi:hypothetical protein
MRPARQPTDVRSSSSLALLITLCLVLQWGGARIFNFDPSAIDGGTKGTALSQVLLFSTNAVALWIVLTSPNTRDLVRPMCSTDVNAQIGPCNCRVSRDLP